MGYGTRVLLEDASFDVARGEILVILGGSGCGKSSLMKNLIGLYRPMAGDVLIDGQSIVTIADRAVMLDPVSRSIIAEGKPSALRDQSADPRVRQFFNRRPDVPAHRPET
jgi:ABC-type transporter Mla maintaining outer membrane lipid asymmetry ATPase subunit MlaF